MHTEILTLSSDEHRIQEARAKLARAKLNFGGALTTLKAEVAEKISWRTYFNAQPVLFLCAALALGFLAARRR